MFKLGIAPSAEMMRWSPEQAKQFVVATYKKMPIAFSAQFRRMFSELLAGRAPLVFNCTAGKDRTGVAAALLLTALGVPRESVVQDYLLTNRYMHRPTSG